MTLNDSGCGAPVQGTDLVGLDLDKETVISGDVRSGGDPVSGAYVRLLDSRGEFTAEVVTSAAGEFRFFAAPGRWTLRALSGRGDGDATVDADRGVTEVRVLVA